MHLAGAGQWNEADTLRDTGFEPDRGACRDVEPVTAGSTPIELQRAIGLRYVHVAADLHGTVAGVQNLQLKPLRTGIDLDCALGQQELARREMSAAARPPAHEPVLTGSDGGR